ncbi:uncharacterized protein CIMG_11285 [Coccidioides immitis RS]|uniref:Uncharacterized protein n=2 Tax=Coccidioides immitis TaxID=5501 RepID=A0A0D8JWD4_COCIM|nr:uncharacterized protein CIMG_11285 [Coccidioides immitis RS]KJF61625.1 hypothetical protein CIMG_11285 [Coccidioides immitis RS]KMP08495.1 hypothetical protein CIRG_08176 [Coccidioides immitis RMSCC 2394]
MTPKRSAALLSNSVLFLNDTVLIKILIIKRRMVTRQPRMKRESNVSMTDRSEARSEWRGKIIKIKKIKNKERALERVKMEISGREAKTSENPRRRGLSSAILYKSRYGGCTYQQSIHARTEHGVRRRV